MPTRKTVRYGMPSRCRGKLLNHIEWIFPNTSVEVKSGASGRLKSLHLFLATYLECGKALVFSDQPFADLPEQKITFLPLYSAFAATKPAEKT